MTGIGADFWRSLPLGRGVRLAAFDPAGLGALDKPAGVLSHPNRGGEESRALLAADYDLDLEHFHWSGSDGGPRRLWLLNRLDSATSGIVLVAADDDLAERVKALFAGRGVSKTYLALVFGVPRVPQEVWRDRLAVERRGGVVRTGAGHVPAESRMRLVRANPRAGVSLLELQPLTGRTHQLRVQCARRHLPIVGDATYGDFRRNREFARAGGARRLFLHSLETRVRFVHGGREREFSARAEPPAEFAAALS